MSSALASIDELRWTGSVKAAVSLAQQRLEEGKHEAGAAFQRQVASRLSGFPGALEKDIGAGGTCVGIVAAKANWPSVVLADGRGYSCCIPFHDGHLAVVDFGFLVDAALFVFFATRPRDYAQHVAAAIFALSVLRKGRAIPFNVDLVELAFRLDGTGMRSIVCNLADMIALHEVGHVYVAANGNGFLAMDVVADADAFKRLVEAHAQGLQLENFVVNPGIPTSCWEVLRNPKTGYGRLVLPGHDSREIVEYAPDVFAALARSVLDAQGPPHAGTLQVWRARYPMWTLTALLLEAIEDEAKGGAWTRGMREMARSSSGKPLRTTHPRAVTRNDVLLFHLRELLHERGVEGRTEADGAYWRTFKQQHSAIWSEQLMMHHELLVQDIRLHEPPGDAERWITAFDILAGKARCRFDELGPKARFLASRVLGELRDLSAAYRDGLVPYLDLPSKEEEIGRRILDGSVQAIFPSLGGLAGDLDCVAKFGSSIDVS